MENDLIDLLRARRIVHPTRIAAVQIEHRQLRLTITGTPWWRDAARSQEEQITFSFDGVGEGLLDPETLLDMEEDEALEVISVSPLSQEGWADKGARYDTYCTEPLPKPMSLYAAVEDYLWSADVPRTARDYLNVPDGSLSRFCAIATTSSFLLARAPQEIHRIVLEELQRQKVSYNVLTNEQRPDDRLLVRIGGSRFICSRATAQF